MKTINLILTIHSITETNIVCSANNHSMNVCFSYQLTQGAFFFKSKNRLTEVLAKYQFQFDKVIKSAIKGKITLGTRINCVFIEGFNFLSEAEYNQFIHLDRRNGSLKISSSREETKGLCKIFADGSYAAETETSGYGGMIQDVRGKSEYYSQSFDGGGSNLMELLAVLEGIKRLPQEKAIQINSDSRFVIRGMAQWMHFWKLNHWQTSKGQSVKFAEYWRQIEHLTEGKFIELHWIKGHSGHEAQEICHRLAQKSAKI